MSMMVSFVLSFFPRDVLDEILNLIGSVSEGFPSYSCRYGDTFPSPYTKLIIHCGYLLSKLGQYDIREHL